MKVTMVSFPTYSRILPLASGYLQAYAQDDPEVRAAYSFLERSYGIDELSEAGVIDDLVSDEADVYTFSCYVWNSLLVRRVIGHLMKARPNADILLGGPQVMNQAEKYIPSTAENIYVCNGEGERTFRQFLQEKLERRPDMTRVRGLSMLRDGEYIRTEDNERIRDLEEIPSPFLNGIFPLRNTHSSSLKQTADALSNAPIAIGGRLQAAKSLSTPLIAYWPSSTGSPSTRPSCFISVMRTLVCCPETWSTLISSPLRKKLRCSLTRYSSVPLRIRRRGWPRLWKLWLLLE